MKFSTDAPHGAQLIAILRGVSPDAVLEVTDILIGAGFCTIEVPLNSLKALRSIELLARRWGHAISVGAGTVLTPEQVNAVADAGADLVLSPNLNTRVIEQSLQRGMFSMPGVATVSEAFCALDAGTHALKLFPADVLGTASVKAWRAVLPSGAAMYAVGGITVDNLATFKQAGVHGVGLGSSLFSPGLSFSDLAHRASDFMAVWSRCDVVSR